jgi:hypothetical protein
MFFFYQSPLDIARIGHLQNAVGRCHGRDSIVVGFTTTYAIILISAYHF